MVDSDDPNILLSKYPKIQYSQISVGEYIHKKLRKYKDKTLLICAKTGVTFNGHEIITYAETIANSLVKFGITKNDTILFHSNNNIQYAMTQFAAYFLGNTITPSKPSHNIYEIQNQLTDTGATIVFTMEEKAPVVKEAILSLKNPNQIKLSFVFDGHYDGFKPFNALMETNDCKLKQIPYFPIDPMNDIATILYTSGSTGLPKGAIMTHFGFIANVYVLKNTNYFHRDSIFAGQFPFGHSSGTMFSFTNFAMGSTIVLIDYTDKHSLLSAIQKYKISEIIAVPSMTALLIDEHMNMYDLSSIRYMLIGGSLTPEHYKDTLIKKFKLKSLREIYGMTEGFAIACDDREFSDGSIGCIGPNMELKITDIKTGKSLPKNCDGEICFRGPAMFKGYLNNPEATASAIDEHGWIKTGDIGHYDDDGRIFITDRIKEMVKFRMYTAFPAEIEHCLMQHEAIYEAVVIGVKHKLDGEWLRAYVILKKGKDISGEEIVKYISDRMAFHKQLRAGVVFMESIPRTLIGKVDRQYFKNMCKNEILTDDG